MLYSKPITEVAWDDVERFCIEGMAENAYLDYKADFPNDLAKIISAMANTFGGLILIGVEEDDSRPVTPVAGIAYVDGLSERVTNIAVSAIVPPVFPEIQVCRNPDGARAAVIIRIPESDRTPHAVAQNTKVYIRTGNVTTPHELATVDRIDWLRVRRQKAVELRETLLADAEERFRHVYDLKINEWRATHRTIEFPGGGWLTLTACPLFPLEALTDPPTLMRRYEEIRVTNGYGGDRFPLPSHIPQTYQQGGVTVEKVGRNLHYVDVGVFGRYFYREGLSAASEAVRAM